MKIFNDAPTLSGELLSHIKDLFPNQLPANEISIEELRYLQGQQSVMNKLEELYNQNFEE
tara:strand:+ start:2203 stop:2382 length:180 start_codon:yes stop_codon:yes gene_type:complete